MAAAGTVSLAAKASCAWAQEADEDPSPIQDAIAEASEVLSWRAAVEALTLEQKVAQLFVVKPEMVKGSGVSLWVDDELWKLLVELPVGGVILKDVNFVSPEQVRELTDGLQQCSRQGCGLPMLVSADEEGGTVVRIADKEAFGVQDPGNMRAVGERGDVTFAESEARRVGAYLRDLGVNLDYAPVSDITSDEGNFVYWRSFGGDPDLVADMVAAQVRGFNASGTLCTPKHFPGIGDAQGDSHVESIFSDKSVDELRKRELVPFVAAIEAGTPMIMVSHMTCRGIDAERPASVSHAVVTELLREELGFDGVVITDSLGMAAVNELYAPHELGALAIEAGCDLLLSPADWRSCYDGIMEAVKSGRLSERRIDESVARIVRLKERLG